MIAIDNGKSGARIIVCVCCNFSAQIDNLRRTRMWNINSLIKPAALLPLCTALALAPATAQNAAPAAAPVIKYDLTYDIISPVFAQNGMVATEQEMATKVGLDILKRGGNAIDAGVAVGFALAVVLPNAGKNVALDFREMAPARASRDMYLDDKGNVAPGRSLYTHLAIGVPGTVAGLT